MQIPESTTPFLIIPAEFKGCASEFLEPIRVSEINDENDQTVEESPPVELVLLMLHDIREVAFNSSSNRVISKSELHKYCFKDGVLENSSIHSPVFISDIHPQYLNTDVESFVHNKMRKFASPGENILSEHWANVDFDIREVLNPPKTWTEWVLGLIGLK
jgi:hypothetical protein